MGQLIATLMKPLALPIERKCLKGTVAGVGIARNSPLNDFFLKERIAALIKALTRRDVTAVEITQSQATWMTGNPAKRGAYYDTTNARFPDAQFYVILGMDQSEITFGVYGAAFDPLLEGATDAIMAALDRSSLDAYFNVSLCAYIARCMKRFPQAFSGQLWYPPESERIEAKKIFTLPNSFR